MKKKQLKIILLIIISLLLIATGYWYWQKRAQKMPAQTPQMPPTLVDASTTKERQWVAEINTTGTLAAMQGVELKAETSGQVKQIFFQSGQYVEAGDPLLQINPDTLKAQLAANMATLRLSKLNYDRAKSLFEKKVASKADLDTAQATYNADQAHVQQTQAQLDQTLVRAPFAGKIGLRLVDLGDYVTPAQAITNLQALNPIRVEFSIPEIYLSKLNIGQTVQVQARAYPSENFIGKVYAFDSKINAQTRSLNARAQIPNPDGKLLPGMFVSLQLRIGQPRSILVIPETAIVYSHEGNYVYRILENRAVRTPIQIGAKRNDMIEIQSGLNKNDWVVTAGQLKLSDGAPVKVRTIAKTENTH